MHTLTNTHSHVYTITIQAAAAAAVAAAIQSGAAGASMGCMLSYKARVGCMRVGSAAFTDTGLEAPENMMGSEGCRRHMLLAKKALMM